MVPGVQSRSLLELKGIGKTFSSRGLFGGGRAVVAAQDVSFRVDRGEAVAIVGESGSGKSTVARLLLRLEKPDGGEILLDGEDVLSAEPRRASRRYRGRVQMVFQDPFGSLNPVHTVGYHLERPLLRHGRAGVESRALLDSIADAGSELATSVGRPTETVAAEAGVGCPFISRCPEAFDPCRTIDPAPRGVESRRVRCHLYPEGPTAPDAPGDA